ncbi:MAG: AzlD domain-containing protein [Anaerolineaceae bacterium]|nr:AzlD domain-containing protein [Anaerolineaceae bacterium]
MHENYLLILLGMTAVTYIPRVLPLWLLTKRELPNALRIWLQYIPPAILAALLMPSLLVQNELLNLNWNNTALLAAIPTFYVAYRFKNTLLTIFVGMLVVGLLKWLLPLI